jgi:hypothetical protein
MKYTVGIRGAPPLDLARKVSETHAAAILSKPRDRDGA